MARRRKFSQDLPRKNIALARRLSQTAPIVSEQLDISHVARLARLKLSEQEAAEFTPQLATVISYIDTLSELDAVSYTHLTLPTIYSV